MEKILQKAWKKYTNNIFSLIVGFIISLLIPLIVTGIVAIIAFSPLIFSFLSSGFTTTIELIKSNMLTSFIIPLVLVIIVSIFVFKPFEFGFIYMVSKIDKRKDSKVSLLFEGVKNFWKRAIIQEFIFLGIICLVSIPFALVGFNLFSSNIETNFINAIFGSFALFVAWFIIILLIGFFLIYWAPAIVIYDKDVIEAAKISFDKVRENLIETIVIGFILVLISIVIIALENVIPFVPSIIISPLSTCILVEACKELK
ncbi:MAG TPA: hypothetical protein EYH56_03075 [Nanoarchaeota archaeon]|nr:hypothetical protein [Nanoarchaeota archaeon]